MKQTPSFLRRNHPRVIKKLALKQLIKDQLLKAAAPLAPKKA